MRALDRNDFANILGYETYSDLQDASNSLFAEGEVMFYITPVEHGEHSGQFAAWDDLELAPERVSFFKTKREAVAFYCENKLEKITREAMYFYLTAP